ncbi:MAG: site-2 protease family protein [Trueperaceae bacterium]|jgi:Zn-dependent protease|nr:site-2 protease family protein [Truepera sp.]HRN17592.1 site-2 protease family protein [Trueperaceae bacterium]HRQ09996.1 site-2 protease family protein [Trueperaceae bacterium]
MFLRLISQPTVLVISAIVMVMALIFHNIVQAFVAERLGDRSPRLAGFGAFEPQRQLDPFGVLFLLLLGFGWPRAVPVNSRNYRRRTEAWVWLAGIGSYLVVAFVSLLIAAVFRSLESPVLYLSFEVAASYAVLHAVVNLFPLLPLDMGRAALAWGNPDVRRVIMQIAQFGVLGFMVFFFVLSATGVIGRIMFLVERLFSNIIGLIPGL